MTSVERFGYVDNYTQTRWNRFQLTANSWRTMHLTDRDKIIGLARNVSIC